MPQLDISTFFPQLFWLLISFAILYLILSNFCLPKLSKIFDERNTQISNALKQAEQNKAEAYRLRDEYEKTLSQAIEKKNLMIEQASKDMAQMIEHKVAEHNLKLKSLLEESDKKLQDFKDKSMDDVKEIALQATEEITSNLFDMKLTKELLLETVQEQVNKAEINHGH